jgi:3-hydroxyacyl-[acyl-carrier-protein] dehydratase
VLLTCAEEFKFRRPVVPGDVLDLKVEILRYRIGYGKAHGVASVAGEISADGNLSFALAKRQS